MSMEVGNEQKKTIIIVNAIVLHHHECDAIINIYVVCCALYIHSAIVAILAPNGKAKLLFLFDCHRKGFNVFIIFPNRFFK